MTIAVVVRVHDGIVMAADSATTLSATDTGNILKVWNNANKIFNLVKGLPIGGMTYGAGNIGHASISTLAKDLRKRFTSPSRAHLEWKIDPENYTMEQIAQRTHQFLIEECFKPTFSGLAVPPNFGFYIVGYSSGAPLGEVWLIDVTNGNYSGPALLSVDDKESIWWAGQPEAVRRLVLGFGTNLPESLLAIGLSPEKLIPAITAIKSALYAPLVHSAMPIQDAVDLAEFLVYATEMFTRFNLGISTVDGPIEVAAVTKHEGFKWVARKHYYESRLNPETRHGAKFETQDSDGTASGTA